MQWELCSSLSEETHRLCLAGESKQVRDTLTRQRSDRTLLRCLELYVLADGRQHKARRKLCRATRAPKILHAGSGRATLNRGKHTVCGLPENASRASFVMALDAWGPRFFLASAGSLPPAQAAPQDDVM